MVEITVAEFEAGDYAQRVADGEITAVMFRPASLAELLPEQWTKAVPVYTVVKGLSGYVINSNAAGLVLAAMGASDVRPDFPGVFSGWEKIVITEVD